MELTISEENYLKAIYKLSQKGHDRVSTNAIAKEMATAAASVTDMIQKLADKDLVNYQKYKGSQLSPSGLNIAMKLIRKHRLWEVFLHDKLNFGWDEVHDIAEQLEHIQSTELTDRLDQFLGFPKFDPHGDPIPNAAGNFTLRQQSILATLSIDDQGVIIGVTEHSPDFLRLLEKKGMMLGRRVIVNAKHQFDQSMELQLDNGHSITVSQSVCANILVKPI